jgi:hypothetical protein
MEEPDVVEELGRHAVQQLLSAAMGGLLTRAGKLPGQINTEESEEGGQTRRPLAWDRREHDGSPGDGAPWRRVVSGEGMSLAQFLVWKLL